MTSVILSASSGNSLSPLSISAPYKEISLEHERFRVETTKYREVIHLGVLKLLPPHLLGGPDMVLEEQVLEPVTMNRPATDPGPDRSKRWVRTEPIVPSPRMLLVFEGAWLDGHVLQSQCTPGMYAFPFAIPTARVDVLNISSSTVFWEVSLNTKSTTVLGDTYWDGFPVPAILPLEEPTSGPYPSSKIDTGLHGLDRRWRRSLCSIHQTLSGW